MNRDLCIAESSEYEGQYPKEINGARIGCHCSTCEYLRDKKL
jgi:hypothetical protein